MSFDEILYRLLGSSSAQRIGKECDRILLDFYEYLESRCKE